nr:TPA_asm: hypothetical protein HUJ06_022182 [Nelumbo nucifera]
MTPNQSISDGETLISLDQKFVLGFFSPAATTNRYVGIWYNNLPIQTIVWVANRENPLADSTGVFTLRNDGNLAVLDGQQNIVWSTNTSTVSKNATAVLADSGNFILREGNPQNFAGRILWQSFDYPSNTLVPGMKVGVNLKTGENRVLRSWKNIGNPAQGSFTFGVDPLASNQLFIWPRKTEYPPMLVNFPTLKSIPISLMNDTEEVYLEVSSVNNSMRLVMDVSGQLRLFMWFNTSQQWVRLWSQPSEPCSVYAICGPYGVCNTYKLPQCKCLPGFRPTSSENWELGDYSEGCGRRSALQCGTKDKFSPMTNVNLSISGSASVLSLSAEDCKRECLNNCSCSAYAYAAAHNNSCLLWSASAQLVDIRDGLNTSKDLYIRLGLADGEFAAGGSSHTKRLTLVVVPAVAVVLGILVLGIMRWWIIQSKAKKKQLSLRSLPSALSTSSAKSALDATKLEEDEEEEGLDIPFYGFQVIEAATNNFDDANKLGQGGFGPVYKGKLAGGKEIAVKRLSKNSGQGIQEFKNEVILIARLQHRNLVKLLGYCIHGDDKMLLYEYTPNKSLDYLLFDENRRMSLNWEKRFNIIIGIARGLLYLHQDSRLRIIHRDLKTSNILLDKEMNPKISDFGMARIFGRDQTQGNTSRVVGTYGYMSPEYALDGLFSVKSDVFSFGIILLEIVSGRKSTGFYQSEDNLSLLGYVWHLWIQDKGVDLIDPSLAEACINRSEVLKCIHVALLCVQEDAIDRPTMASVLVILLSETAALPPPKRPALFVRRSVPNIKFPSYEPSTCSSNHVTVTFIQGR